MAAHLLGHAWTLYCRICLPRQCLPDDIVMRQIGGSRVKKSETLSRTVIFLGRAAGTAGFRRFRLAQARPGATPDR